MIRATQTKTLVRFSLTNQNLSAYLEFLELVLVPWGKLVFTFHKTWLIEPNHIWYSNASLFLCEKLFVFNAWSLVISNFLYGPLRVQDTGTLLNLYYESIIQIVSVLVRTSCCCWAGWKWKSKNTTWWSFQASFLTI